MSTLDVRETVRVTPLSDKFQIRHGLTPPSPPDQKREVRVITSAKHIALDGLPEMSDAEVTAGATKISLVVSDRFQQIQEHEARPALPDGHMYDVVADIAGAGRAAANFADNLGSPVGAQLDQYLSPSALYSFILYGPLYIIKTRDDYNAFMAAKRERGNEYAMSQIHAWQAFDGACLYAAVSWGLVRALQVTSLISSTAGNAEVAQTTAHFANMAMTGAFGASMTATGIIAYKAGKNLFQVNTFRKQIQDIIDGHKSGKIPYTKAVQFIQKARCTTYDEVMKGFSASPDARGKELSQLCIERAVTQSLTHHKAVGLNEEEWRSLFTTYWDDLDNNEWNTEEKKAALLEKCGIVSLSATDKAELCKMSASAIMGFIYAYKDKEEQKTNALIGMIGKEAFDALGKAHLTSAVIAKACAKEDVTAEEKDHQEIVQKTLNALSLNPFKSGTNQRLNILMVIAGSLSTLSSLLYVLAPYTLGASALVASVLWLISALIFVYVDGSLFVKATRNVENSPGYRRDIRLTLMRWGYIGLSICLTAVIAFCLFNHVSLGIIAGISALYLLIIVIKILVQYKTKTLAHLVGVPQPKADATKTLTSLPKSAPVDPSFDELMAKPENEKRLHQLIKEAYVTKFPVKRVSAVVKKNCFDQMMAALSDEDKRNIAKKFVEEKAAAATSTASSSAASGSAAAAAAVSP